MSDVEPVRGASPDARGDAVPGADGHVPQAPITVEGQQTKSPSFVRWLLETAIMVALAFLLAQGIKTFVVQPFVIPTGSMEPTIMSGDRVLAEKITYRFRNVQPGDIVVFDDPTGRHPQLIKRVIAVSGQTLDINNGKVYVDGERLDEPYLDGVTTEPGNLLMPVTLADNEYWLMGDNRPNSGDSRFMGPVDREFIQGRGFAIYWPLDRIGPLR
ncbi:MAG: signal peptidase I [Clostridiales bacterium]|nr:signal peptidase I [Clostridiales bacterium]